MNYETEEEKRRARRRKLIEERKRKSRRLRLIYGYIRKFGPLAAGIFATAALVTAGVNIVRRPGANVQAKQEQQETVESFSEENGQETGQPVEGQSASPSSEITASAEGAGGVALDSEGADSPEDAQGEAGTLAGSYSAQATFDTKQIGAEVDSSYAILIDLETGNILAQKAADTIINPASMTKVLTVLVAAEHVNNLDDTFTITLNETDYSYINDCSSVGFAENEVVTVRDLFYGTILPSGGDAAAALAAYVAGSREAFVDMMNEKLEELGLSDTAHMTNCVGIYDENHYCTVYDMAMIMEAALDNDLCREVLSAHTYTTSSTEQHPEGITISNWFLRRIEDKDTGGEVICAKTGYVNEAGSCAVSYGRDVNGREYICVTADADGTWKCIYDHVALYKEASGT